MATCKQIKPQTKSNSSYHNLKQNGKWHCCYSIFLSCKLDCFATALVNGCIVDMLFEVFIEIIIKYSCARQLFSQLNSCA